MEVVQSSSKKTFYEITLRLDTALYETVKIAARLERESMSDFIRGAIKKAILQPPIAQAIGTKRLAEVFFLPEEAIEKIIGGETNFAKAS